MGFIRVAFYYFFLKLYILSEWNGQTVWFDSAPIINPETRRICKKNLINRPKHLEQYHLFKNFHIEKSLDMLPMQQISQQTHLINWKENKLNKQRITILFKISQQSHRNQQMHVKTN